VENKHVGFFDSSFNFGQNLHNIFKLVIKFKHFWSGN